MRLHFTHNDYHFELSAGDPPPCSEEERDRNFEKTLACCDGFPEQPSVHHTTSWIVARLAALTGDIEALNDGYFANDGGEFGYRLKVSDKNGNLVGRCGVLFYRERIHFAGFGKDQADIRGIFVDALLADPTDFGRCEIHSQCGETHVSEYFGFDGYALR